MTGEESEETDRRMIDGDEIARGRLAVHSLSGHERNHLFVNRGAGGEFVDLSAVSGLDSAADGRSFAVLDYDRDGWQDVVLVNANNPLTELYHNNIGEGAGGVRGGIVAVRFVGGNTTPQASGMGNRDGYGATVEVELEGGQVLKREHRCGEGFAAQNSATMIVGIGGAERVGSVTVRWPSGRSFTANDVPEGTLLTAYEDRAAGAFTQKPYRVNREGPAVPPAAAPPFPVAREVPGKVQVYTTTATWCPSCLSHLPQLGRLADDGVALFGVPVDPEDDAQKLAGYVAAKDPPYQMLADLSAENRKLAGRFIAARLNWQSDEAPLPSSVITDSEGRVLEVLAGVPTVSAVRRWMR